MVKYQSRTCESNFFFACLSILVPPSKGLEGRAWLKSFWAISIARLNITIVHLQPINVVVFHDPYNEI